MPPSLYLQTLSGVLSLYRMARASYSRPLTLTLSPGRGNRFVDAATIRRPQTPQGSFKHNNQPYFQTQRFSKP